MEKEYAQNIYKAAIIYNTAQITSNIDIVNVFQFSLNVSTLKIGDFHIKTQK